ncbi:MAG: hypothetical protein Q8Q24_01450 [bacterium]|nr:hypothetical protein [bacterium]
MNKEISPERIKRHIDFRIKKLHQHEESRLLADQAGKNGESETARILYEKTVKDAEIFSRERFVESGRSIIQGWIKERKISPEEGESLSEKLDLGYAGEARIATVAATSQSKCGESPEKSLEKARSMAERHQNWQDTILRLNKTIEENPILWEAEIWQDKAGISREAGDLRRAAEEYETACRKAMEKVPMVMWLSEEQKDQLLGAMSAGGVAKVKEARIREQIFSEKEKENYTLIKDGKNMVIMAVLNDHNFERGKVILGYYTAYLFKHLKERTMQEKMTDLWNLKWEWRYLAKNYRPAKEQLRQELEIRFSPQVAGIISKLVPLP